MLLCFFFFFNDTATTEIYTLSLHDALPILERAFAANPAAKTTLIAFFRLMLIPGLAATIRRLARSEEHTSELQSLRHLVCRLLLEKKNINRSVHGFSPLSSQSA